MLRAVDPRLSLLAVGSLLQFRRVPSTCEAPEASRSRRRRVCVVGDTSAARVALRRMAEHPRASDTDLLWLPGTARAQTELPMLPGVKRMEGVVQEVSGRRRRLRLRGGESVEFDRCLLALGRCPPSSDFYENFIDREAKHVYHCSDPQASASLLRILKSGGHVTIIGSDWRAIEFAANLAVASNGFKFANNISLVLSDFIMAATLPKYLSSALQKRLKTRLGIEIVPMVQVQYVGGRAMIPAILHGAESASIGI